MQKCKNNLLRSHTKENPTDVLLFRHAPSRSHTMDTHTHHMHISESPDKTNKTIMQEDTVLYDGRRNNNKHKQCPWMYVCTHPVPQPRNSLLGCHVVFDFIRPCFRHRFCFALELALMCCYAAVCVWLFLCCFLAFRRSSCLWGRWERIQIRCSSVGFDGSISFARARLHAMLT